MTERNEAQTPERWTLTGESFTQLLEFLDRDRDRAASAYDLLHRKLIKFFDWRGSPDPEHLADLTLNRVARKLEEGTVVRSPNPAAFVLGVARMVFLEESRRVARQEQVEPHFFVDQVDDGSGPDDEEEVRMRILEKCLDNLDQEGREFLLRYYAESGGTKIALRKQIARDLGVSSGVLRLRAHRLRQRLEACVSSRLGTDQVKRFSA